MLNTHIKVPQGNMGVSCMGTAFLTIIQNLEAKGKLGKFVYVKIKQFMHAQNVINRTRRQRKNWGKEYG